MILKSISFACIIIITISFSAFPDAVGILERRKLSDAYHMKNIFQLIRFSKSKNHIVKHQAVQYLGVLKNITSINALIDCMDDEFLTMTAADALSKMGKSAVIPLIDALSSKSENIRCGAALALAYLGPLAGPAVPALIDILPKGWFSAHMDFVPNIAINKTLPHFPRYSPNPETFFTSPLSVRAREVSKMVIVDISNYIAQSVSKNKQVRELKDSLNDILHGKIDKPDLI